MIGAILAAGRGTRMQPFSTHYPKPILPIANKPLLQHQIELARDIGISEFIIVIGHLGYEIAQKLGDGSTLGVKIRYVEQQQMLGIAHAFGQLEPLINEPVLLFLGDIFFVTEELDALVTTMQQRNAAAVLAAKEEPDPLAIRRNFTVLCDENNRVIRVIEKPRHPTTTIKGCGLYLFDESVFDAVRRTPRTALRDEYEITDTIQIMIDDGSPVYCESVVRWDINLTYPHDVLNCNLFQLDRLGASKIVGHNVQMHPGATMDRVVLGDNVKIDHPIHLSDCVVLADTHVTSGESLHRYVLTPDDCIDCGQTDEIVQ